MSLGAFFSEPIFDKLAQKIPYSCEKLLCRTHSGEGNIFIFYINS